MKNVYIQNEDKKSFKDWTKKGLEFLLFYPTLSNKTKIQIKSKIKGETNEFSKTRRR